MTIVAISVLQNELHTLSSLLSAINQQVSDCTYILVQSDLDSAMSANQFIGNVKQYTKMAVLPAKLHTNLVSNQVYVLPTNQYLEVNNHTIVYDATTAADTDTMSSSEVFWNSLANNEGFFVGIAMYPDAERLAQMRMVQSLGALTVLCDSSHNIKGQVSKEVISQFNYVAPPQEIAKIIADTFFVETPSQGQSINPVLGIPPSAVGEQMPLNKTTTNHSTKNQQKVNSRLDLISNELEQQGLQLLDTFAKLRAESAQLEQQKLLLESVLLSMRDGVMTIDANGQIMQMNHSLKKMLGVKDDIRSLTKWLDERQILNPDSKAVFIDDENPLLLAMKGYAIVDSEIQVEQKSEANGTQTIYLKINALPLQQAAQAATIPAANNATVLVISDITNRKRTEIELRKSELTQKALLNAIPDVMVRVNRDGVYLDYIPAKDEGHIPTAAFIGNKLDDIFPEYEAEDLMECLTEALDTGVVQKHQVEFPVETDKQFYEIRFSPLNFNEALGIIRQVTDKVVTEDALRKSAAYFRMLMERSPAPVIVHDIKGRLIDANSATLRMLGAENASDLKGKNINHFIHSKDKSKFKSYLKYCYNDDVPDGPAIYQIVSVDGQTIEVEAVGSMIMYENRLVVQAILRDVTEENQIKQQLSDSEYKYRALFEANPDGLVILDPNSKAILDCNDNLLKIIGYNKKESILGTSLLQYSPDNQSPNNPSNTLWNSLMEQIATTKDPIHQKWVFLSKEGKRIQAELSFQTFNFKGKSVCVATVRNKNK